MTEEPTIPLREHFEALFALKDSHQRELRAADKEAVQVALQTVKDQRAEDRRSDENWRENANEYRGQLKDQAATFVTRTELEASQRNASGDRISGRSDIRGTVTLIIAIAAFAITTLANFGSLILR